MLVISMRDKNSHRRHRLEIYHDILIAIENQRMNEDEVKPTRIAHYSNLSYDRLYKYLDELEANGMIYRADTIFLTEVGQQFLKNYEAIKHIFETDEDAFLR
jgi:predicted transcriptional regulator